MECPELVRRGEYAQLPLGVSVPYFVEDIRILASHLGNDDVGDLDLPIDAVEDAFAELLFIDALLLRRSRAPRQAP